MHHKASQASQCIAQVLNGDAPGGLGRRFDWQEHMRSNIDWDELRLAIRACPCQSVPPALLNRLLLHAATRAQVKPRPLTRRCPMVLG